MLFRSAVRERRIEDGRAGTDLVVRSTAAIVAHIDERDVPNQVKVNLCSGARREAVECYVASPPGRFDASRHMGANALFCTRP